MRTTIPQALRVLALAAVWLAALPAGAVTNAAPWAESFEDYDDGAAVAGTRGWSADSAGAGLVTTDAAVVGLLGDYAAGGRSYPLDSAPHAKVLRLDSQVRNDIRSAPGGIVTLDLMALPLPMGGPPAGDPAQQYALCVVTNGHVLIWHRNTAAGGEGTNEWLDLQNAPLATGVWARFSIRHDYAHGLFQVSVNEGAAFSNAVGWSAGGVSPGGPWFHMVQTNGYLNRLRFCEEGTNYLDDVTVTNRSLQWAGAGFAEHALNNGTIAAGTPIVVTLRHDAFAGEPGDNLAAAGRVLVTGLPANLAATVLRQSETQAVITLTGAAAAHESADSVPGFTVQFLDDAFVLGNAADVAGAARGGWTITFNDTPRLSYAGGAFAESAANDGAIDASTTLTVLLTNGTFGGTVGEDFGTNSAKVQFSGLPAGLAGQLQVVSATELALRLTGQAAAHAAVDGGSFSLAFRDGAFVGVPAASVLSAATTGSVAFVDPAGLTYASTVFTELPANDGSVGGATVALSNKTFNAAEGEDLVAGGKIAAVHVPDGLGVQVVRGVSPREVTVTFTGVASAHAAADSIANLGLVFGDGAFVGANAAGVAHAARGDLAIVFSNQPVLTAVGTTFTEAAANNGTIGNSVVIALDGAAFTGGPFTGGVHFVAANVPAGLTLGVTGEGAQATLTLAGTAAAHAAADGIANLRLTFLDPAFPAVAAANVTGHPIDYAVVYADPAALTYHGDTFTEIGGGAIDNRSPNTITLAGDAFAGADGDDFVARGWVLVTNLPPGLAATVTRDGATQLSVRLTGVAPANAPSNSVLDAGLAFLDGAFAHVPVAVMLNGSVSGLKVLFVEDTGFFNVMPYQEPFEPYANGTFMGATNGWSAAYPDAGVVTNDAVLATDLRAYLAGHSSFPVAGDHQQVLSVQASLAAEIHTEGAPLAYLDFMMKPVPVEFVPDADTNRQYAFYVSTNRQLVIWHRNTTGAEPFNEWLTLTQAALVSTSEWVRFTVAQDYASHRFQIRVNEGRPVVDAAGWVDSGLSPTGSWFHMVQTNASLSRVRFLGAGTAYLDDVTVRAELGRTFGQRAGSVFKFR